MIPADFITAWRSVVPWPTNAQVEQDLVLSRAIVDLFADKTLSSAVAFRGGTALHKMFFERPLRYSEDIDLVQAAEGPIGSVLDAIRAKLNPWLGEPKWKKGEGGMTLTYRFDSETEPVTPLRLKIEINTREHFAVLGWKRRTFRMDSPWHRGEAEVQTYEPEELLGTKLRALYQRRKGRDLFDLSEALNRLPGIDGAKIVACFARYIEAEGTKITRSDFEANLAQKIKNPAFLHDMSPLLGEGVSFEPARALEQVQAALVSRLPGVPLKERPRQ